MMLRLVQKNRILARSALQRYFSDKEIPDTYFMTGTQSFDTLVTDANIFVDKTLLMHEILKSKNQAILFTRPRRWGKTLNLNMIKNFFEADVDKKTGVISYKTKSKQDLFKKLKIQDAYLSFDPITNKREKTRSINCLGSFPVISLRFKGTVSNQTLSSIYSAMIAPAFKEHSYLLNVKNILFGNSRILFETYVCDETINNADLSNSLEVLIEAIYKHYERKVILLIDEYDRNLMNLASIKSPLYADALNLIRDILNPIKELENKLQFTVLTGGSIIVKSDIFTELNHFDHDSVMSSRYPEFFGFTEDEVDGLIAKVLEFNPKIKYQNIKNSISEIYNGYHIEGKIIYNPWSIMNCLQRLYLNRDDPFSKFWANSGNMEIINDALKKLVSIKKVENLFLNGYTDFTYNDGFQIENIYMDEEYLLSFLVDAGYLTHIGNDMFKIPNNEVKNHFYNVLMKNWLKKIDKGLNFNELIKLNVENCEEYAEAFQQNILDKVGIFRANERTFQIFIIQSYIGCTYKNHTYNIEKNITQGKGINILFKPVKDRATNAILLEIKLASVENDINSIGNGYSQMFEKKNTNYLLEIAEKKINSYWTKFNLRAAVFSKLYSKNTWVLNIHEVILTKEGLDKAVKTYNKELHAGEKMINFFKSIEGTQVKEIKK
ncbi:hypothetical protein SteCoe_31510 [Stentor coeruleus]|uniref:AAA-ATPase-like domain-containing protein n=1 Tax=Stentor coeruleus TaxID=5963 RepID=A0A1R2B121_9CILI|nr:hypothetical protein SteCoe_31510 [Stentor coeruleus]